MSIVMCNYAAVALSMSYLLFIYYIITIIIIIYIFRKQKTQSTK